MKEFLISLLLVFLQLSALAQYRLSGTIRDTANEESLPGAVIFLENTFLQATASNEGHYQITNISKGVYELNVHMIGYNDQSRRIEINGDTRLDVYLKSNPLVKEEVVVQATRVPGSNRSSVSEITDRDIQRLDAVKDLPYLIQLTPSAITTSDAGTGIGYTGIRIRGTDATRINVTLDGIPFNNPESQEVYWVDIPDIAGSVSNLQVQRGVGTSTNGAPSFGGSLNIQTEKPESKPSIQYMGDYGSFNTLRNQLKLNTGNLGGHWAFNSRFSRITSDGYIDRATADMTSFALNASWFDEKNSLKASFLHGKEITYQAWDGVPGYCLDTNRTFNPNGSYYDSIGRRLFYDNEVDNYKQQHYLISWTRQLESRTHFNISAHFTRGMGYYEQYKDDDDLADYKVTPAHTSHPGDLIRRKWMDNAFRGVTWSMIRHRSAFDLFCGGAWNQYDGKHFGRIIWAENEAFPIDNFEWYRNLGVKKDFNVYAKALWKPRQRFRFYADMQFRAISYRISGLDDDFRSLTQGHHYSFWNPKTGVSYSISEKGKLSISAGIAHREPNRSNFTDADPGKTPQSERLTDIEIGYEHRTSCWIALVNLYRMNYKDQLVLSGEINNVGAPVMTNIENSYRQGIEMSLGWQPGSWFHWQANLTLSQNKIPSFSEYVDNWDEGGQITHLLGKTELSFSPAVSGNSQITLAPLEGLYIDWTLKYVGMQYIDNTASADRSLDPYLVNDLRFSYSFSHRQGKKLSIYFQLNNLLDEQYESNAWVYRYYYEGAYRKMDGYFPQAGRNFISGISLSL